MARFYWSEQGFVCLRFAKDSEGLVDSRKNERDPRHKAMCGTGYHQVLGSVSGSAYDKGAIVVEVGQRARRGRVWG
jgi:hypothetical protein